VHICEKKDKKFTFVVVATYINLRQRT